METWKGFSFMESDEHMEELLTKDAWRRHWSIEVAKNTTGDAVKDTLNPELGTRGVDPSMYSSN